MRKDRPYIYPYKTNQLSKEYWDKVGVPLGDYDTDYIIPKKNRLCVEDTRKQFLGRKDTIFYVDPTHPYVKKLLEDKIIIPVVEHDPVEEDIHEDA